MNNSGVITYPPLQIPACIKTWWDDNKRLFFLILLIGLFAFGYELCNFTFSINEEDALMLRPDYNKMGHAGNSRWAMFAYDLLLPGVKYPFISCFLGIIFLALAYSLYLSTWKNVDFCGKLVFGSLAISSPIWAHMQEFSFMSAQVACSMLFTIVSSLFAMHANNRFVNTLVPMALLTFSIFTYQSLVLLFFAPFAVNQMITGFDKAEFYVFVRLLIIGIAAVILFYTLDYMLFDITGYEKSIYLDSYIGWTKYTIPQVVNIFITDLKNMFTNVFITWQYFYLLSVPVVLYLFAQKFNFSALISLCITVCLYCSLWVLLGNCMNSRMLLYIPFIFAGIFFAAYIVAGNIAKIAVVCLAIYITIGNASTNTHLFMMDSMARERDNILTSCIFSRVFSVVPEYMQEAGAIAFIGKIKESAIFPYTDKYYMEGFGMSYWSKKFEDDSWILYGFLKSYGIPLPPLATPAEIKAQQPEIEKMPSWPEAGCIKLSDKMLIVKLS